ncbi:MAG: hypothetical protein J6P36_08610 [Lachnospiraceae bacterium]|nr:hypothetical protein [Lachnospiraceae bacterium]
MGVPEMISFWDELCKKVKSEKANAEERKLYKKLGKTMRMLSENPRHPGLESHEIGALSNRFGAKVWESYLENNTPSAGRVFWVYGPNRGEITIVGLEPHPNDKNSAYDRVTLSSMGDEIGRRE